MHKIYFSFYHVLIFLGIFQGLLLAYIFLFNKKFRKKSSIAFAIGLIALSLSGVQEIFQDLDFNQQYRFFRYLPLTHISLVTIGLYYFVVFLLNPNHRFNKKDFWFLLPFALILPIKLIVYILHLSQPSILENNQNLLQFINIFLNYLPILYTVYTIIYSLQQVKLYHYNLYNNFSNIQGKELYWLQNLLYALLLFSVYWFFIITQMFIVGKRVGLFYSLWVIICCLLFWIGYFVILRRDIFAIPVFKASELADNKPALSNKTNEHYQKLLQLIEQEKLYQDTQLSMDALSQKMDLSNGYLSKIINQKEGKNFYEFINNYRIEAVKSNLNNPDYAHYSILGIGLEAGFKSKSTFNSVFKKMTGMTPSAYKKSLNNEQRA